VNVTLVDSPASWADAIAALPAAGPLPSRTVLVPSERHAHALRRTLSRTGRAPALAGTRFLGPLTAAMEVLGTAGVPFTPGEDALRPARLLALFREDLGLEHFDAELLRSTRGWDGAFAAAIADLEAAGLGPEDLPRNAAPARDLARLWSRAAADAGASLGSARILREAAALLARDPRAWPFQGPALALATGHEDAVHARFLAAIPGVTLALRAARPLTERHLHRIGALYGAEAAAAIATPTSTPTAAPTERDLLSTYLLADASTLSAPGRPRSRGPDGTVDLEEHAGVDSELEATALWVARQILEHGRPLEGIAVLVPSQDPLAQLVADRLERLGADGAPLPVHVAGGLPAISTAGGARILAVLRALRSHLSAETLAPVLPALRLAEAPPTHATAARPPRTHLTHGEALEIAFGLGIAGGNAAHPEGALAWSARAAVRLGELEAALARARTDEDSRAREQRRLRRTLDGLRAVHPALDALVGVARAVVGGAPLAALAAALTAFLDRWLLAPGPGAALPARLAEALAPACAGGLGQALDGEDALDAIEAHLLALRVPRGRFGEPAVYVGAVAGAAGLDFEAVRIVGLCEGVLPSPPREDPVVPGALRDALERAIPGRVLARAEDRVAAQVHSLVAAVQGASAAVALSAPRVDLARTEREPASIFIDAAAALGRPGPGGAPADPVPDAAALRRDAFGPAARAAAAFGAAHPVSAAGWLDRAARVSRDLPPEWTGAPALDLGRLAVLRTPTGPLGPADGVLGPGDPFPAVPGIAPERPISAAALQQLLQCPRMFLMRRILGWDEPAAAPSLREIDPPAYGTLLHRAVEVFYREHGPAFARREGALAAWQALAGAAAERAFEAFLSEYPLVGEGVRLKERERLHDGVRAFLEYDWQGGPRRFVGVEVPFGTRTPLAVAAGGETLHLQGFIDRVDVEGEATVVRDLKSGKAHPRVREEAGPTALRDVQLGVYQLAARRLAGDWEAPTRVTAAYAYASGRGEVEERAFRADAAALQRATEQWLGTAAHLLAARAFPASADERDCTYCPFHVLCGSGAAARSREALSAAVDGPLAGFRALKLGEEDEE